MNNDVRLFGDNSLLKRIVNYYVKYRESIKYKNAVNRLYELRASDRQRREEVATLKLLPWQLSRNII